MQQAWFSNLCLVRHSSRPGPLQQKRSSSSHFLGIPPRKQTIPLHVTVAVVPLDANNATAVKQRLINSRCSAHYTNYVLIVFNGGREL